MGLPDGGYTQIVPAFTGHPVYANVNDVRLAPNSISSFGANISDTSFHSIFAPGWDASVFTASEVVQNANTVDVGGFNAAFGFGFFQAAQGPDGEAISLIRNAQQAAVDIDIKPGSDPNSINTKSMGLVRVAILGSASFDVTTVNVATISFGPAAAAPAHDLSDSNVYNGHLQDVNGDGFPGLVSHYRQKLTGIVLGDSSACLTGQLFDGTNIQRCDAVNVVN